MELSIVIPAYNEEKTIAAVIEKVARLKTKKEVIIVNDGSTDQTKPILEKLKTVFPLKVYHHRKNQGKGAAIKTGVGKAKGEYVIIQDADLEYEPEQIIKLLVVAKKRKAPVVYGSRFKGSLKKMSLSFRWGNQFLTFLTNLLYGCRLSDMETCYKLFERKLIQSLDWQAQSFDFEPEVTALLLKRGIKIIEVPIDYVARRASEGKKITWQDGVRAAWLLVRLRVAS